MKPASRLLVRSITIAIALSGCASPPPTSDPESSYLDRAARHVKEAVVVTASVLDEGESEAFFGARLHLVGIQPVWIGIENLSAYSYVLFLKSIDRDYFSPYEAARRASVLFDGDIGTLYRNLRDQEITHLIAPGAATSGFVYTHLDEGFKAFSLDLVGNRNLLSFHIAVDVPGLTTDYADFQADAIYHDDEFEFLDSDQLREWLQALPCCTASKDGTPGDPINVVLVGDIEDIRSVLVGQGWDVTAKATPSSIGRIMRAFIFGSRYRYAPISELYLFGRVQDMTFQKARAAIDERNHVRLWLAPVNHEGTPVWVGHISRDAGIKLSGRFWPPTTHVIDPAVDEARFYLEQDLIYSNNVRRFGLVDGVGAAESHSPRRNAEQDPYFTDGLRAVFFVDDAFVSLDELEVLNWSLPAELEPFRESIFLLRE
ncbi:MAG TPA: LssY C-terminal domain-containing protein [Geminicoccaceae bacterium]|nr:LssY C-terminal domain-containing protein [Geminicoccaceae bacterium]